MTEKTFRIILVVVAVVWVVFVLVPSVVGGVPRLWQRAQYLIPGNQPQVVVTVNDSSGKQGLADARVDLVLKQTTLQAVTDSNGQVVFPAVPAGQASQLRVEKVDYDAAIVDQVTIPRRQRAGFNVTLSSDPGQRVYIAQDNGDGTVNISVLDSASRLLLSPPGQSDIWNKLPALSMVVQSSGQSLYALTPSSVLALSLSDPSVTKEIPLQPPVSGLALSPDGSILYVVHGGTGRGGRTLTAYNTSSWETQFTAFLGRGTRLGANGLAGTFPFSGNGAGGTGAFTGTLPFGRFGGDTANPSGSGAVTNTLPFGRNGGAGPGGLAITSTAPLTATSAVIAGSDGRRVYVATRGDRQVTAYDALRGRPAGVYPLPGPVKDIALSLDNRALYALTDGGLFSIDTTNGFTADPVALPLPADLAAGAASIVYSEYQYQQWVAVDLPARNQVAVVDLNGQTSMQLVGVGSDPVAMAPIGGSDNLVVANRGKDTLSLVSLSQPHVADTIEVHSNPSLLAVP